MSTPSDSSSSTEIDYTQPVPRVRLLIADVGPAPDLSDAQLRGLLAMYCADPDAADLRACRNAAADACDALAMSQVLTSRVIRTADGTTVDGSKVSAELRARAATLRAQVETADAEEIGDLFDVQEFHSGGYGYRSGYGGW